MDLDICGDCLCWFANGETPNDDNDWQILPEWDKWEINPGRAHEALSWENPDAIEDAAKECGINTWQIDWESRAEIDLLIQKIEQHRDDAESEGGFSWSPCDCCGGLTGNRYPATARKAS